MEIKTAFSSQFNHDVAIKGSGLLGMFFVFVFFFGIFLFCFILFFYGSGEGGLSQVPSTKSRKIQKWRFEDVFCCCFVFLQFL